MTAPAPTVTRIPRTVDGCTWRAEAHTPDGRLIGATAHTRAGVLEAFADQWERFA